MASILSTSLRVRVLPARALAVVLMRGYHCRSSSPPLSSLLPRPPVSGADSTRSSRTPWSEAGPCVRYKSDGEASALLNPSNLWGSLQAFRSPVRRRPRHQVQGPPHRTTFASAMAVAVGALHAAATDLCMAVGGTVATARPERPPQIEALQVTVTFVPAPQTGTAAANHAATLRRAHPTMRPQKAMECQPQPHAKYRGRM